MGGSIPDRLAKVWSNELGVGATFLPYLRRQLWKRGLRHPFRLHEAMEIAVQQFAIEFRKHEGDLPTEWRAWRVLLDRVVYQAMRELRPCGSLAVDLDLLKGSDDELGQAAARERARKLIEQVERLPVALRLVAKLKLADVFLPAWAVPGVPWESDEAAYLLKQHPGHSLEQLNAELHSRRQSTAHRHRGKIPSKVIAWLLGRASADAVDTAFREIKQQLRNAAPPGAAGVSNALENRTFRLHASAAVLSVSLECRRDSPVRGGIKDRSRSQILLTVRSSMVLVSGRGAA